MLFRSQWKTVFFVRHFSGINACISASTSDIVYSPALFWYKPCASDIEADPQSLASSFAYAKTIQELGVGFAESQIQDLFLLWNKVNRSASTMVIELFSQHAQEQGLKMGG